MMHGPFPLTPALSLRERERRCQCLAKSRRARFTDALTAILPLLGERAGVRGNETPECMSAKL